MKLRLSKCYPAGPIRTLENALFLLIEREYPTVNFLKTDSLSSTGYKINLER